MPPSDEITSWAVGHYDVAYRKLKAIADEKKWPNDVLLLALDKLTSPFHFWKEEAGSQGRESGSSQALPARTAGEAPSDVRTSAAQSKGPAQQTTVDGQTTGAASTPPARPAPDPITPKQIDFVEQLGRKSAANHTTIREYLDRVRKREVRELTKREAMSLIDKLQGK